MLTEDELRALLKDMESDRVERTLSTQNTDKHAEAICAFSNDYPGHREKGYLILGAKDNGEIDSISITDELLNKLGAIRSDGNILPQPALSVYKMSLPEGEVAVVEVQPSSLPPVRYKGRVYIRVGPREAIANEQEERILSERRAHFLTTFDTSPIPSASIRQISLRTFEEYRAQTIDPDIIAENHRTTEEKLAALRCFDLRAHAPTVGGILLFGEDPSFYLPGAYVQFLKFSGTAMTHRPEDDLLATGDLRKILEMVHQKIISNNTKTIQTKSAFREETISIYPEWALREFFHNAVMHRNYQSTTPIRVYWYADRVEIQSPGGLYGEVTAETLERRNSYRNPVLAEALRAMGYVNRYGYGIYRAQHLLKENGHPPAEFEVDDQVFLVTIRRRAS